MNYETIKMNYHTKLWNESMVQIAVKKGVITEAQYQEITGQKYKK